jgi:hypothetical protein
MVDWPLQNLYARENQGYVGYHVEIWPSNVWEHLFIKRPYIQVIVWDTLRVLLSTDSIEKAPPLWEHYFGSGAFLCITKDQRLEKGFLC